MPQKLLPAAIAAVSLLCNFSATSAFAQRVAPKLAPSPLPEMAYDVEFFPGAKHDPGVPTIETILGFPAGSRAASTAELKKCLDAWAAASKRVRVVEYARSHEGRPLHYVVISDPANIARLGEIKAGTAKLADPRTVTEAEANHLIDTLPGVAWLSYTIHGDETEGSDAALAVIHHLAAAQDDATRALLRDVVVVVDPVMNPDGRDRFIKMIAEARGTQPNVDDQSLVHEGHWAAGRTNHYGFDLNRDWIYGTQPETIGRWRNIGEWNPQMYVDGHGMGSQESFLFSPPRAPMNPYFPASNAQWSALFAKEHGEAFDRQGWTYYTGEWNEGWYPGYSDTWPAIRGGVGILYEQARMADDGVRRAEGTIQSYREAVHGNVVSSMANLATFHRNARELRRSFRAHRLAALDPEGPFARRTWAVLPTANDGRLKAFTDCLAQQGIEIRRLDQEHVVKTATDHLGRERADMTLPQGTLLIANRQPLGHLAATLLDFDPKMPAASLKREREDLLKHGESGIYDMTAWNLTMLHGLEAVVVPEDLSGATMSAFTAAAATTIPPLADSTVGWVADGANDASVVLAARLMEHDVQVRVSDKAFEFDGISNARGSVIVSRKDNRLFRGDLRATVERIARECAVGARPIRSGYGTDDLPDLGGAHFGLLTRPRVAILTRGSVDTYDFGSVWHLLDHTLAIRNSTLSDDSGGYDLRRYNVIVIPNVHSRGISDSFMKQLGPWVEAGGTLIAIRGAAAQLSKEEGGLGSTRTLPDALKDVEPYRQQVLREWLASRGAEVDQETVWARTVQTELNYPWRTDSEKSPDDKELKRRDEWQRIFMPHGVILSGRIDPEHWLTSGTGGILPTFISAPTVLLAPSGVESPVRFGVLEPVEGKEANSQPEFLGWSMIPAGHTLALRMAGLLWPEAGQRLANASYLTRESVGRGQVILFAGQPTFRAASLGTQRLLMNAIVHGPGMGAQSPIIP